MLITDKQGRPWWCPELEATDIESIEKTEIELSSKVWKEYEGLWNINPGAEYD